MEHQTILNLLNDASDSKFVTRKWNVIYDNSNANNAERNENTNNTEVLKSSFCDQNDAYILVRDDIAVLAGGATQVAFKNFAQLTKYNTQIDGTTIDVAEDLHLVISMYNLIEYNSDYSETAGSLQFNQKVKQLMLMQVMKRLIILNPSSIKLN